MITTSSSSISDSASSVPPTTKRPRLILGPFHGQVACQTIALGRGVVGGAAQRRESLLVPDVDAFPGHIACDDASRSEVVVPVFGGSERRLRAVIDVDCAEKDGFDEEDARGLERLAELLGRACDWPGQGL